MSRNRSKKPPGLSFETLERREVFAGFTGGLSNGVLTINGTVAADKITLTQTSDVVRLDGYTNAWSASAIKQIRINAGAGNDTVRLAVSKQLAATLVGDGGAGHDVLYATAQPKSWTGFEVGTLISPPAGTEPAPTQGVQVVWSGNTGPYTVSIYRRGDGATGGGEMYGNYSTRQDAEKGVAEAQKWASQINNGGYWDIVKIKVEGQNLSSPATPQVNYNGYAVSDAHLRGVLKRISEVLKRDIVVTSGDRYEVVTGSNGQSLHLQQRAVDFHVKGLTDQEAANQILRYSSQIFTRGEAYEFIQHGSYTNTGGAHLHLGHYPPGGTSAIYFKQEGLTAATKGKYSTTIKFF